MKDLFLQFPGRSVAPDANYPTGSARNVTTQGDGTGTPWVAVVANDIQGFFQRVLARAGITASNNNETALVSQVFDGLQLSKGLPGEIIQHCWTTIPTGVRVINLEGQVIDISGAYAGLAAAVYVGDGANPTAQAFYKTSDSGGTTRSTTGTYMVMADAQGRFLRGLDPTNTFDPDVPNRLPGSDEDWASTYHHHRIGPDKTGPVQNVGHDTAGVGVTTGGAAELIYRPESGSSDVPIWANETIDSNSNPGVFTGKQSSNETRPLNMAVQVGIWY